MMPEDINALAKKTYIDKKYIEAMYSLKALRDGEKPLNETQKKGISELIDYTIGNQDFNLLLFSPVLQKELRDATEFLKTLSYKTRNFKKNDAHEKIDNFYSQIVVGNPEPDKMTLSEYGYISDLAKVYDVFTTNIRTYEDLQLSSNTLELIEKAKKANEIILTLENNFENEFRLPVGSLMFLKSEKYNHLSQRSMTLYDRLFRNITKYGHVSHGVAGKRIGSHLVGADSDTEHHYANTDLMLFDFLYQDTFQINLPALISNEMQQKLHHKYGDSWQEKLTQYFGNIEQVIHDRNVVSNESKNPFSHAKLTKKLSHYLKIATAFLRGGHKKMQKSHEDEAITQWLLEGSEDKTLICSEFAGMTIISSITLLNEMLQKELETSETVVQVPISEHERLHYMHPERLFDVLNKRGAIIEVGLPENIARYINTGDKARKVETFGEFNPTDELPERLVKYKKENLPANEVSSESSLNDLEIEKESLNQLNNENFPANEAPSELSLNYLETENEFYNQLNIELFFNQNEKRGEALPVDNEGNTISITEYNTEDRSQYDATIVHVKNKDMIEELYKQNPDGKYLILVENTNYDLEDIIEEAKYYGFFEPIVFGRNDPVEFDDKTASELRQKIFNTVTGRTPEQANTAEAEEQANSTNQAPLNNENLSLSFHYIDKATGWDMLDVNALFNTGEQETSDLFVDDEGRTMSVSKDNPGNSDATIIHITNEAMLDDLEPNKKYVILIEKNIRLKDVIIDKVIDLGFFKPIEYDSETLKEPETQQELRQKIFHAFYERTPEEYLEQTKNVQEEAQVEVQEEARETQITEVKLENQTKPLPNETANPVPATKQEMLEQIFAQKTKQDFIEKTKQFKDKLLEHRSTKDNQYGGLLNRAKNIISGNSQNATHSWRKVMEKARSQGIKESDLTEQTDEALQPKTR